MKMIIPIKLSNGVELFETSGEKEGQGLMTDIAEKIEEANASPDLQPYLNGAAFIYIHTKNLDKDKPRRGIDSRRDYGGIDVALTELLKNPQRLIICFHTYSEEDIYLKQSAAYYLSSNPNVIFVNLFELTDLKSVIKKAENKKNNQSNLC